jgi:aldehyde dehydrogenase (NAD+)
MREYLKHYINGQWVNPRTSTKIFETINPATESISGRIILGDENDVNAAVIAAKTAFKAFSQTTREKRLALMENILAGLIERQAALADAITEEMGAPKKLAFEAHAAVPIEQAQIAIDILKTFSFDKLLGSTLIRLSPIGVCGLITPWNWPAIVVMAKVLPALATGNTVVLKPSEYAPFSANIIAQILHDAGLPAGVFNMVYGDGKTVGEAISSHPDIQMISFTGSTRAGIAIAKNAADSVKRVHQELGGKSPNIILPSADLSTAVESGLKGLMSNSGQTCCAPSRMIVPNSRINEVKTIIEQVIDSVQPANPMNKDAFMGPVVNNIQYERIQTLIKVGIESGAKVMTGGLGRPSGMEKGYFVKPTVFTDTKPDMDIVQQEIFGPVLVIQGYDTIDEAVALANNTEYGLAAYVQGSNKDEIISIANLIPAGQIYLNSSGEVSDFAAPFGGFKRSGNGRENGESGFEAFLESKALIGYQE